MDVHIVDVYIYEIKAQCEFALSAIRDVDASLAIIADDSQPRDVHDFHHREVFRELQSFLVHASNISQLLWPSSAGNGRSKQDRAAALRSILKLPEDEHALKSRRLRDSLAHFDERLDDWANASAHHNVIQDCIGLPRLRERISASDVMRCYDPPTQTYHFRGESFEILPMAIAIDALLTTAHSWIEDYLHNFYINGARSID